MHILNDPVQLSCTRFALRARAASIPRLYLAVECGRLLREAGRQAWFVYGLLRTAPVASTLPATTVTVTLPACAGMSSVPAVKFVMPVRRIIVHGSDAGPGTVPVAAPD